MSSREPLVILQSESPKSRAISRWGIFCSSALTSAQRAAISAVSAGVSRQRSRSSTRALSEAFASALASSLRFSVTRGSSMSIIIVYYITKKKIGTAKGRNREKPVEREPKIVYHTA